MKKLSFTPGELLFALIVAVLFAFLVWDIYESHKCDEACTKSGFYKGTFQDSAHCECYPKPTTIY